MPKFKVPRQGSRIAHVTLLPQRVTRRNASRLWAISVALLGLLILPSAASATVLPATITENMTLTPAGNPYTGSPTIEAGATVVAEPGTIFHLSVMTIKGTLKAEGTAEAPVVFTSNSESGPGDWQNLKLEPGSGASILDHSVVRYGGFVNGTAGIEINGSSPRIENSVIRNNKGYGIKVKSGGSPEIAFNEVLSNTSAGVVYETSSTGEINIHDNAVKNNVGSGIDAGASGSNVGGSLGDNSVASNGGGISYSGPDVPPDIGTNVLSGNSSNTVNVQGTIKQSSTWEDNGYRYTMSGELTLASGATWTLNPGVTINSSKALVKGTLIAEGTAEAPVVFTSAIESAPGDWQNLVFEPGSDASVLDHAVVRYGGFANGTGGIEINGASPRIENSVVHHNKGYGIKSVNGAAPEIAHNEARDNTGDGILFEPGTGGGEINIHDNVVKSNVSTGISTSGSATTVGHSLGDNTVLANGSGISYSGPDVPPDIGTNVLSENKTNTVSVQGTIKQSSTWLDNGYRYTMSGELTLAGGATWTLKPGVTINSFKALVKGTLKAEGTAKEPVVFTSSTESGPGNWQNIVFEPGSGVSVLDHAVVRYGGFANGTGGVLVNGSSPTIENTLLRRNKGYGIKVSNGGSPEIAYNEALENTGEGITYEASSTGEIRIHDNLLSGNGGGISAGASGSNVGHSLGDNVLLVNGSGISYSGPDVPPDIGTNVLIGNSSNTVNVQGTIKQSSTWEDSGYRYTMSGELTLAGGAAWTLKPGVTINSSKAIINGTLKAAGTAKEPVVFTSSTESGSGNWQNIRFEPGSGASVLDYTVVRYGGFIKNTGGIEINGASPTIKHSAIRSNKSYGIKILSGTPTIERNSFSGNPTGLHYGGAGILSAPHNYWGCSSGPQPAGCGNGVSGNVEWRPQAEQDSGLGQCRGKETQCGEGADPVSLATGYLTYEQPDLLLTNKSSVPLEFMRAYNSGDETDTGLGHGWSQSGLASATELENGNVLVRRQDGRQDTFLKTEGGYTAPSGVTSSLTKIESTFQLTTLENTVYSFDISGRIASITDDHGLKTTYGYDGNGRLATITDPSAQTLTFSYNASSHITSVKDSTGREVKYGYSGAGDLATVTDALGGVTEYTYDAAHRIKTIKDPRGNVVLKNTYDGQGRVVEQKDGLENLWNLEYKPSETIVTEPEGGKSTYGFDGEDRVVSEKDQLGRTTSTSYDVAGNVDEIVRPGGAKWQFGYDAKGNLTSVIDPEEGERSYEYDAKNRLVSFTDERGETWAYEWDEANDLKKVTDPAEGETAATYNAAGQPLAITDPNEHTTTFTYDTRGNRLTAKDALENTTAYAYNTRNQLTSKTAPGLEPETYGRNALGDLLSKTTPEGHKTEYAYNANGLLTKVTDPAKGAWEVKRNAMERATAYVNPLEQESNVSYDGNLRPVKVTDRRGKETTYAYDLANQLTELVRPEGGDWAFDYDGRGNRIEVVDPRENASTYEFDLRDRMTDAAEPLAATTSYEYDPAGNLVGFIDPRENTSELAYDELGRLTAVNQPLEKATTFTYDANGNRLTRTTAAGTIDFDYDAANRLEEVKDGETTLRKFAFDPAGRLTGATDAQADEIEIGYDDDGRVVSIDDGRGQTASREYDSRDNLVKQVDGRGTLEYEFDKLSRMVELTDPQEKVLDFDYDPEGNLTKAELPNGVVTTSEFDNAGRLAETTSAKGEATLESLEYEYDPNGNRIGQIDRLSQETSYEYDALNRLVGFDPPGEGSASYDYDPAGNRIEAGATTYSFNDLNQLTAASNGTAYDYDEAGRLIETAQGETSTTYAWSALDELTSVNIGVQEIDFAYDALGRQVLRDDGSTVRPTHYGDLSDLPILDTDAEGEPTVSYVQGPEGLVEQRSGEATSFPLRDAHGDITTLADGGGEVASRQTYDPWGKQLTGPSLEMGWLGAQQRRSDPATELLQMGIRPYSSGLGSFVAEDPVLGTLGESQSLSRYPYAWNNPLNLYDLDGREVCAGLGPIQGCVDSDGPSVSVEPCLPYPGVSACVGEDGPKICVNSMVVPIGACEDPETAAKYGEACARAGATGALLAVITGVNLASITTNASIGCGSALIEKVARRFGQGALADDVNAAGKAWDGAEILCSLTPRC